MDFFEQQAAAKRRTGRLVWLFVAAVVAMALLVWLVVLTAMSMGQQVGRPLPWLEALVGSVAGVGVVVGGGSMFKVMQLASGGGAVVAGSLGGRALSPDTHDAEERKLLNVVEEMAIASGVPMPKVYLLEREEGINAFAAGYSPETAVLGFTKGCVANLSREELQGVVAHEFSHVLNGDMRLNIRMIGVVFGIFAMTVIGRVIVRSIGRGGRSSSRSGKNSGGGGAVLVVLLLGVALIVIGYLGVLFGRLIQAAVSRQREFLADASAVQFTRNPQGIGDALRRIGGVSEGSAVASPHATEAAHLFFGSASASWASMLATHPPLDVRIKRVLPQWDGSWLTGPAVTSTAALADQTRQQAKEARPDFVKDALAGGLGHEAAMGLASAGVAERVTHQVGKPAEEHVAYARQLIASLPGTVRQALRQPTGAQAVVWAMLLGDDEAKAMGRADQLAEREGPAGALVGPMWRAMRGVEPAARMVAVDLAVPALVELGGAGFDRFWRVTQTLVMADGEADLFEWMVGMLLHRHAMGSLGKAAAHAKQDRRLAQCTQELGVVLSALSAAGGREEADPRRALSAAQGVLRELPGLSLEPAGRIDLEAVGRSLGELDRLKMQDKRKVVEACAACVSADRAVTDREAQLLRLIADAIGVPIPPMLPGQRL